MYDAQLLQSMRGCHGWFVVPQIQETAVQCSWKPYMLDLYKASGTLVPQCEMDHFDYLCKSSSNLGDWVDGTMNKVRA